MSKAHQHQNQHRVAQNETLIVMKMILLLLVGFVFFATPLSSNAGLKQLTCDAFRKGELERVNTFVFDSDDLRRERPTFSYSYRYTEKCNSRGCTGESSGYMVVSPNHISFFGPLMGDEVRLGRLNRKNLAFEGVNPFSKNTYECRLEDLEEPLDNLI
jgi:hypothetical protein